MVSKQVIAEFGESELWEFIRHMLDERIIINQTCLEQEERIDKVRILQGAVAEDRFFYKLPEALKNDYTLKTNIEFEEDEKGRGSNKKV